jgi:PKHD-type hydroxylase
LDCRKAKKSPPIRALAAKIVSPPVLAANEACSGFPLACRNEGVRLLILVPNVLGSTDLSSVRGVLATAAFHSGRTTASGSAARVKNNLQLPVDSEPARSANQILVRALREHEGFQTAAWCAAMTVPLICRYDEGMGYGNHIDGPLMGEGPRLIRCDLAATLLLVDPASYDGGELVIGVDGAAHRWKGGAGDCVIYPADTVHRVEAVTRGVRLAAVFWIQTLVRDFAKRKLLHELGAAIRTVEESLPELGALDTLHRSYSNLIRMWIEPEGFDRIEKK